MGTPKKRPFLSLKGRGGPEYTIAHEANDVAAEVSYLPVDCAEAQPRPASVSSLWHEEEYDALGEEQEQLFGAGGELEARSAAQRAAEATVEYDATNTILAVRKKALENLSVQQADVHENLSGYVRRGPHAEAKYWATMILLLLADIVGVSGAVMWLGEPIMLALLQGIGTGVAAVTSGLVGREIGDLQLSRRRAACADSLPTRYAHLAWMFSERDAGSTITKAMIWVAATVALLLSTGILLLRGSTDGAASGLVFGLLALAICLASVINNYHYADVVADHLKMLEIEVKKAERAVDKLGKSPVFKEHDAAKAEDTSIRAEYSAHGVAARKHFQALKAAISRLNPAVAGHGAAPAPTATKISLSKHMLEFEKDLEDRQNGAQP